MSKGRQRLQSAILAKRSEQSTSRSGASNPTSRAERAIKLCATSFQKSGVALAIDPPLDVPSRCGTQKRPAWEAMHAPSLDVPRTGAAPSRPSITQLAAGAGARFARAVCLPASHVTVGPGADRVRPQEGQSCVFFIKPSHLRHRHLRPTERSARDAAFRRARCRASRCGDQ
jgi:hypothetical protein